jgi:tetratricopeptide (TPR) repeat protein
MRAAVTFFMSKRICPWFASVLVLLGALLSGCAMRPAPRVAGPPTPPARTSADAQDYSDSAVDARTESHARYTAAILDELNDDHASAAENYYRAAAFSPGDEELVLEAAAKLLRQKQTDRAIEILKKCANRSGSSAEVWARLGLAYSVAGRKELAIEASRSAIRKDPTSFEGYQYLAQQYLQSGQREEGIKVLDEAARQPKTDAEFLIDLGEAYLAFLRGNSPGDPKAKASDAFRRATALNPIHPSLLQRLADGFNQLGESDRAIEYYNKLLQKVPALTFVRDRLIDLYLRRQERDKAAQELKAALKDSPANPQAQYLLGSIYLEDRKLAEAEDCFNKALLLNPAFEPAYYDLAMVLVSTDKPRQAIETLDKARSKFKQTFIGEFYTGLAYSRLKDYAATLKHFTTAEGIARASATNRLTHTFYFQVGSAYERNQKFQDAETYFRKALEISPDFAEALNYLGYMWAERGENLQEARTMIEKAVKLDPKNPAYLDSMGWVLFKLQHSEEALTWIQKSIEHSEDPDATLYDHLGDIYERLNQATKARDAWKKSVQIEANPQVEKKLKGATSSPPPTVPEDSDPR